MIMDTDSRPASFFGGRPTSFFNRTFRPGHNVAPSIGSTNDPGMAGQGAFRYQQNPAQHYQDQPAQQSQQASARALQPRQQYTFGQTPDGSAAIGQVSDDGHGDHFSDSHGGAYGAQPQPQDVYNLEAYGDYHSFAPETPPIHAGAAPTHSRPISAVHDEDAYGGM